MRADASPVSFKHSPTSSASNVTNANTAVKLDSRWEFAAPPAKEVVGLLSEFTR